MKLSPSGPPPKPNPCERISPAACRSGQARRRPRPALASPARGRVPRRPDRARLARPVRRALAVPDREPRRALRAVPQHPDPDGRARPCGHRPAQPRLRRSRPHLLPPDPARILLAGGIAVPLGLLMGRYRLLREIAFPICEVLRPIPAIAWVPMAIMLWPTNEARSSSSPSSDRSFPS